jgi:uncharacterized protein (DUF58 family)
MKTWILKRYADWLNRRIPPRREITLVQSNIFIYPNWQFIYYFIAIMLLWIAATNYENNLSFGLSFLLLALFLVCILHTYNNLAGLTIAVVGADPVFAGEYAAVELLLSTREGKIHDALNLGWEKNHFVQTGLIDVTQQRLKVAVKATKRGLFNPKRMTLDTVYPLGIIRSVSYLDLDITILVYPQPVCHLAIMTLEGDDVPEGQTASRRRGSDEFSHLREYEAGVSLKQVAWKQFAKGRGMQVREYADYVSEHHWLDWDHFPGLGVEERLSTLCYWALELDKRGDDYGLRIPGVLIAPGAGDLHRQKILTALALYGTSTSSGGVKT